MMLSFGSVPATQTNSQPARPTTTPTQGQIAQQAATGGGFSSIRDSVVQNTHRRDSLKAVGIAVAKKGVLDKAGVTKPAAAKRG